MVSEGGASRMNLITLPAKVPRAAVSRDGASGWRVGAWAWFSAVVSLVLAVNTMFSRYLVPDSYYDLFAGRYIVLHGIPHHNVVTVASRGASWTDQQWLAQVVYYCAWVTGGYQGLVATSAVLVTAGFAILALVMRHRDVPPTRMFAWTAIAFLACLGNTVIRAQSFAYPLFALTLWLVLEDSRAARLRARTWLLVPVLVLWANIHGSVLLGAGFAATYAGYRVAKAVLREDYLSIPAYLALAVVAPAAVLCTPYGTAVLSYYARFVGNPVLAHYVPEWSRPSPLDPLSWGFFALALGTIAAIGVAWHRGTRPDPLLGGLALILLALALTAIRNQAWFAFAGSLLAADTLARSSRGRVPVLSAGFRWGTAAVLGALAVMSLGALAVTPDRHLENGISPRAVAVTAAIASSQPGLRVLGDDSYGSAVLWLAPVTFGRVAFDARLEQYSDAELNAYADFLDVYGPRWQRAMSGYGVIVLSPRDHPGLAHVLKKLPGWRIRYQDGDGLVLERQASA